MPRSFGFELSTVILPVSVVGCDYAINGFYSGY